MIHLLIRKIILYSDRVEIYYNYTSNKGPDDDCSQGLSFFSCTKSFTVDYHKFDIPPTTLSFQVVLYLTYILQIYHIAPLFFALYSKTQPNLFTGSAGSDLAEKAGFEPAHRYYPVYSLSRGAP